MHSRREPRQDSPTGTETFRQGGNPHPQERRESPALRERTVRAALPSPPAHTVPPLDAAHRRVPVASTNGASTAAGARGHGDRDRPVPVDSYRVSRPSLRVSLPGDLIDRSPPAVRHPRRSSRNP